jgi:hypothetical protein
MRLAPSAVTNEGQVQIVNFASSITLLLELRNQNPDLDQKLGKPQRDVSEKYLTTKKPPNLGGF